LADFLPDFRVTVTVTLQVPAFTPFRLVPDTLQYFADEAATFNDTFDVFATVNLAKAAIDFAVAVLLARTVRVVEDTVVIATGIVAVGTVTVTVGVGTGGTVVDGDTVDVDEATRPSLSLMVGDEKWNPLMEKFNQPLTSDNSMVLVISRTPSSVPTDISTREGRVEDPYKHFAAIDGNDTVYEPIDSWLFSSRCGEATL
jgi:hypothetical protein